MANYKEFPVPSTAAPNGNSLVLQWRDLVAIAQLNAQNETNRLLARLINLTDHLA